MDANQAMNWTQIEEMLNSLTQEQIDQAEWRIRNTSKLPMRDFQIAIGFLFGLATLAFFGRIAIRLGSRRRIFLDDGFLTISFVCLAASTGVFYTRARIIYLVFALMRDDEVAALLATQVIADVYDQMNWSFAYITFLWTTVFMVKFTYFAFFHTLLRSMPRNLTVYYWCSVAFTAISWIYLVLQQLIVCPYFGSSSFRCFPTLPISNTLLNYTFWMGPVLDALTDALIISVPIIVLRKTQMALITKIGFGVFLCLSLFMVACSITRAAGTYYGNALDTPWQVFWLHAEACIAVLMGSITVYRSVLIGSTQSSYRIQNFLDKIIQMRTSEQLSEPEQLTRRGRFGRLLLSKIPTGTLTGLGTLFGRSSSGGETGANLSNMKSTMEMTALDYHEHLRSVESAAGGSGPRVTMHSRDESLLKASSERPTTAGAVQEEYRRPSPIAAFFLRFLFPQSLLPTLRHRATGIDQTQANDARLGR